MSFGRFLRFEGDKKEERTTQHPIFLVGEIAENAWNEGSLPIRRLNDISEESLLPFYEVFGLATGHPRCRPWLSK
jgi:hypothetical protein